MCICHVEFNKFTYVCAVSLCGRLKPEMQLLPTATSRVPLIELEQYVGLCHCYILLHGVEFIV